MKRWIRRSIRMGLHLALAAGVGGCELPLGERPCGHGWCPDTMMCAGDSRCVLPGICGNSVLDPGEQCDDGNTRDGDGCSRSCQIERCGNGIIDLGLGEVCDDGNTRDGDGCSSNCKSKEICGNGIVDVVAGEVCDDGNTRDGDGCRSDCKSIEICGNGIVDVAAGEVCDDGSRNGTPGDPCSANCRSSQICNNAIVDPGEECDHGAFGAGNPAGNVNSNDCRADCQFNRCGDGFIDAQPGSRQEECDDGHLTGLIPHPVETASCNIDCTGARCGDGKVNQSAGEQCDDGNATSGDGCSPTCQIEH